MKYQYLRNNKFNKLDNYGFVINNNNNYTSIILPTNNTIGQYTLYKQNNIQLLKKHSQKHTLNNFLNSNNIFTREYESLLNPCIHLDIDFDDIPSELVLNVYDNDDIVYTDTVIPSTEYHFHYDILPLIHNFNKFILSIGPNFTGNVSYVIDSDNLY